MSDARGARVLGPVLLGFAAVFGIAGLLIYRLWDPFVEPETGFEIRATPLPSEPAPAAPKPTAPTDPLNDPAKPANEYEYLRELERLSAENKSKALELAFAGEQWYGDTGPAAEARRAMQVTLLADIGRGQDARKFATRFLSKYPKSKYAIRVRQAVGR
jgi:hypothetical protein